MANWENLGQTFTNKHTFSNAVQASERNLCHSISSPKSPILIEELFKEKTNVIANQTKFNSYVRYQFIQLGLGTANVEPLFT